MKSAGSFPVATIGDDLTVERELLEAPSSEPTQLGGWDFRPAHSLEEALEAWCADVWGNA